MQKKMTLYLIIAAIFILPHCKNIQEPTIKETIQELYTGISGFGISPEDSKVFASLECASTYGEITFEAVKTLTEKLNLKDSDVFYDLGCGVGKMVIQVYLSSPVKKSIGIELSSERADKAIKIQQQLNQSNKIAKERTLAFYKESFLDANLDDATVVYLASTCFPDELMKKITEKLATLKTGLRVITLKKLAENAKFKLVDEFILPMTWSDSTNAYLYELI